MTALDIARKLGFIEFVPRVDGYAVLWHVGGSITNVAESDDFYAVLERARTWASSEGVPFVRSLH